MTRIKSHAWLVALVVFLTATGLVVAYTGRANTRSTQDAERTLDIERYPNEPLELVGIKVSGQSIKDKIKVKNRRGNEGLDNAKFTDKDDWFRRVSIRLRNVSDKPIVGLRTYLYFEVTTTKALFRMPLERFKRLQQEPLKPVEEIDLTVSNQLWNQMADILKQHGVDPNMAAVSFSVESVMFSDGLQWNRGYLVRPDPNTPNKWIPVDKQTPKTSRLDRPVQFTTVALRLNSAQPQTDAEHCVQPNGSVIASPCAENYYCNAISELGGMAGTKSSVPVNGVCEQESGVEHGGITCAEMTTHYRLRDDPSCPIPTPTPTPAPTPAQAHTQKTY